MPKPIRRRMSAYDVNRELQSPALLTLSRPQRRAAQALLRVLDDANVGRFEIVTGD